MIRIKRVIDARKVLKKSYPNVLLIPVDFSEYSATALVFAAEMAKCSGASLLVLHIVHDPGEMPGYYDKMFKKKRLSRIQDAAEAMFEDFMERVIEDNPSLDNIADAEKAMVTGVPVPRILEVIQSVKPKMVIVGSHGHNGIKRLLLGSKAEQLVHLSPAPITVIKKKGILGK